MWPLQKDPANALAVNWGLRRMCIYVQPQPGFDPTSAAGSTTCSDNLQTAFYKLGISTNPAIINTSVGNCVKSTGVFRAGTGVFEVR